MRSKSERKPASAAECEKAEKKRRRKEEKLRREAERKRTDRERAARRKKLYAAVRNGLRNPEDGFAVPRGSSPRVEIIVEGDFTSAALRLTRAGAELYDITREGRNTRFKIRKKEMYKVIAILEEMCYNYKIGERLGVGRRLKYMLSRFGFALGIAASAIALHLAYGYVWRVEITGNDRLTKAELRRALSSAGIAEGTKKSLLGKRFAAAISSVDGIADASFETSGTVLYVRVLEATERTERQESDYAVAQYDAVVTRVVARSGSSKVSRGDKVRCGDVLATGEVFGTDGELLFTGSCDVEVYGEVSLAVSAALSPVEVRYERTGRRKRAQEFCLFGCGIGRARSPYASYDTVAHTSRFDVLIPLYATTYTFYETKAVERERDIASAVRGFAEQKTEELMFTGDFDYSYTAEPGAGGLIDAHLFITGEALISRGEKYS